MNPTEGRYDWRDCIRSSSSAECRIRRVLHPPTGHGIRLEVHEHPYIVEGNTQTLEPVIAPLGGPGIYLPGRFGVRIEHIVVVTEDGVRDLNSSERDLVVTG